MEKNNNMGFGGHAADMLYKMKYNKSLRDNNRENYNWYHDAVVTYKKSRLKIEKKYICKEDIEVLKMKVINEVKRRNQIAITVTAIFTIVIGFLIAWLFRIFLNCDSIFWYIINKLWV